MKKKKKKPGVNKSNRILIKVLQPLILILTWKFMQDTWQTFAQTCFQFGCETTHSHTLPSLPIYRKKFKGKSLFLLFWITECLWHYTANQLQMFNNVLQVPKCHMKILFLQNYYTAETCQHVCMPKCTI